MIYHSRDRIAPVWQAVRDHFYNIIVNSGTHSFLVERAVVGLLRISIRLLRREEIAAQVLTSLRILLMMKSNVVHTISRQVSYFSSSNGLFTFSSFSFHLAILCFQLKTEINSSSGLEIVFEFFGFFFFMFLAEIFSLPKRRRKKRLTLLL